jgi:arsenical pump membrane protein
LDAGSSPSSGNQPGSIHALNATASLALSAFALLVILGWAVVRPRGWPEAVVAVPTAALLVAIGALPWRDALGQAQRLAPVLGFLAAVLVLAQMCDDEGVFALCGSWLAQGSAGRPVRLLAQVFVLASLTTAVLSLDATVVLLTPVVFATAARLATRPKPHVYACTHLANSASLLLPVSNLTNLLAFAASGLTFARFAALMALPWLAVIGLEYLVLRRFFAADLARPTEPAESPDLAHSPEPAQPTQPDRVPERAGVPVFALGVIAATLAGFVATSAFGVNPAWAAFAGALVLAVRALAQRRTTVGGITRAAGLPFLAFVLGLGLVVRAVVAAGLGRALAPLIPAGHSLTTLLIIAGTAAVLANLINNLPAVLVLIPLTVAAGSVPATLLAVLIGVNVGPNLTYTGSLATLLWRRVLHARGARPSLAEFTRLGLLTVPAALVVAVLALWAGLTAVGG